MKSMMVLSERGRIVNYICESSNCRSGRMDHYYSYEEICSTGWTFVLADRVGNKKASGMNMHAITEDGTPCEVYCPECSKQKEVAK